MNKMRKKIFATAGYYTVSFGSGRKEFRPKGAKPGFETYIKESAEGTCAQLGNCDFDEGVISNFMAARFIKQAHLAGFLPMVCENLRYKPCTRVEGACGSGGMGITTAVKTVLSDQADSVFVMGFEIQNSMKAIYGADVLAGAGYFNGERKDGHAYFFPAKFSDRAGSYFEKYGTDEAKQGMAKWYEQAIANARLNPKAQEYHNRTSDLFSIGMTPANPKAFLQHLTAFDCSKVSDGASSLAIVSEEGMVKLGVKKEDCVELAGYGHCEDDITQAPPDLARLETTARAAGKAMEMAGITKDEIGIVELHDCFTITALLALESIGFVEAGGSPRFILDGHTGLDGSLPANTSGGLIGYGHYTGGTGVRQLVDLLHQSTGTAGDFQVDLKKPYGLMVSMGGNDKTVVAVVTKQTG